MTSKTPWRVKARNETNEMYEDIIISVVDKTGKKNKNILNWGGMVRELFLQRVWK